MNDSDLQRFAILLMLFGGFLDLGGGVTGDYAGIYQYGKLMMVLALILGLVTLIRSPGE
jgi:hypothetical protein